MHFSFLIKTRKGGRKWPHFITALPYDMKATHCIELLYFLTLTTSQKIASQQCVVFLLSHHSQQHNIRRRPLKIWTMTQQKTINLLVWASASTLDPPVDVLEESTLHLSSCSLLNLSYPRTSSTCGVCILPSCFWGKHFDFTCSRQHGFLLQRIVRVVDNEYLFRLVVGRSFYSWSSGARAGGVDPSLFEQLHSSQPIIIYPRTSSTCDVCILPSSCFWGKHFDFALVDNAAIYFSVSCA
jgi:hypothetical protein